MKRFLNSLAVMIVMIMISLIPPISSATAALLNESTSGSHPTLVAELYATGDGEFIPFDDLSQDQQTEVLEKEADALSHREESDDLLYRLNAAIADGINSPDFLESLSPSEKKLMMSMLEPAKIEIYSSTPPNVIELQGGENLPTPDGVRERTDSVISKSWQGFTQWQYFQWIRWEYDGVNVTSTNKNSWGSVGVPGYQYLGATVLRSYYSNGRSEYNYRSQGTFGLCFGWCIQHFYPWIHQIVYGNGSSTSFWGI